ncbi:hypothetical protein Ae201684P_009271 [Aphanomyces euteiches]|nr:hypothetical protein Ae201684P_009271 [Aphanomyces euteiches]
MRGETSFCFQRNVLPYVFVATWFSCGRPSSSFTNLLARKHNHPQLTRTTLGTGPQGPEGLSCWNIHNEYDKIHPTPAEKREVCGYEANYPSPTTNLFIQDCPICNANVLDTKCAIDRLRLLSEAMVQGKIATCVLSSLRSSSPGLRCRLPPTKKEINSPSQTVGRAALTRG